MLEGPIPLARSSGMMRQRIMKILFMGRKPTGARALEWTLSQGHEVVGVLTDNHLTGSPCTAVAEREGLRILELEEVYRLINLQELDFDLGVSFVYWRILKEPLISAPAKGVVNFHPAPLPDWKGVAGYNMAILEALDSWGVSAHYVDAGVDTGAIIDIFRFSIDHEEETVVTLEAKSQVMMFELYKKTIRRIAQSSEKLPTTSNVGGRAINKKLMEAMRHIQPGDDIDRKIRAFWFPPYGGACVTIEGKEYTLVNDAILKGMTTPGTTNLRSRKS